jgi:hypothetical protein
VDLHRRLAARAGREGRSLNAVATEILDAAADADHGDRKARARARAAAAGLLSGEQHGAHQVSRRQRRRIIESTRGLGPLVDGLIAEERDRG